MSSSPLVMAAGGVVMIAAAAALLFGDGGTDRRLRERVQATRDLKTSQSPGAIDYMIGLPTKRSLLTRLAEWLGYRADLPKLYAASLKIVMPVAGIVGSIAFRLGETMVSPGAAIIIGLFVAVMAARFLFRRKTKAYAMLLFKQIPDAMSLMLRAVRAGLPVAEAIRSVSRESMSPTREEFTRVAGEAALGMPIEITLRRLYERTQIQEYAFFSVVIGLHGQTGGNLSETIENLAEMVRRRVAMAGKAKALSAEGRLSAVVVGALPFVVGILTSFANPTYMSAFMTDPKGPFLIGVFAVLLSIGLFMTHVLVQQSTED